MNEQEAYVYGDIVKFCDDEGQTQIGKVTNVDQINQFIHVENEDGAVFGVRFRNAKRIFGD
ncbi:hypothetical protein EZL62_01675 [Listeria monocytogenes]|nr:hypothetical protein [Listeria monocytogenes]